MSPAPKVSLRPLAASDSERLRTWRNLPEIARWMYSDHVIGPEEHARWLEGALADGRRRYWVIEAGAMPVGLANLYDLAPEHGRTSWAYYVAEASVRGKGVGAAVEFQVIEQVFAAMGLNKLWCEVLIDNKGVIRLHESFGFQREALMREHVRKDGQAVDVVGLGLLAADWALQRPTSLERLRRHGFEVSDL